MKIVLAVLIFSTCLSTITAIAPHHKDGRNWKTAGATEPTEATVRAEIQKFINENDIAVFSKTYCPYCARVKGLFKELKEKPSYMELDTIAHGFKVQDLLAEISGSRTVPQVFIAGEYIGGSSDTLALHAQGQLVEKLQKIKVESSEF